MENRLLTAEEYLRKGRYLDARDILEDVLENDRKNGRALYLEMLALRESSSLDSFIACIDTFEDFDLLISVIDNGERSFSEDLLGRLCNAIKKSFASGDPTETLPLYKQIASYGSQHVAELHALIADGAPNKIVAAAGRIRTTIAEMLDIALLYSRVDEEKHRKSLQNAVVSFSKGRLFTEAAKYLFEYKEAFGEDAFYLLRSFVKDSLAEDLEAALRNSDDTAPSRLEQILNSTGQKDSDDLLGQVAEIALSFIGEKDYPSAGKWTKFLSPYDFTIRNRFRDEGISLVIKGAQRDNYELFKVLVGFFSSNEEEAFLLSYNGYADQALREGHYEVAYSAFSDLVEYCPKSEKVHFSRILALCGCDDEKDLPKRIGALGPLNDFEPIESYLSADDSENAFLMRLDRLTLAAKRGFIGYGDKSALQAFERLCAYYPVASDQKLIADFLEIGKASQDKGMYEEAVRFYSLAIGLGNKESSTYWLLLQAKLKCKDDEELVACKTLMAELPEFENAKAAAGKDQRAISRYVECQDKQERYIAKCERNRRIKRRAWIIGSGVAIFAAFALTISLLTKDVFVPKSHYDSGVALINEGHYQEALSALEGLGYSDSNAQVLVAKAGIAFEGGDYEMGISKIYDAGGTVKINYDADGGTTNTNNRNGRVLRKSAYVKATAEKPGYTFVEWKQQNFSITTKKEEYSAEVGLKASYQIVTYHITYDLDGGSLENPVKEYTVLANDITIGSPTKTGYTFAGWSGTNIVGTQMTITIPSGSVGDRSYVAHWTPNEHKINYDYGYGGKTGEQKVTYGENYELNSPSRDGYEFQGWYEGNEKATDGAWLTDSDKTLTAKWSPIQYAISYYLDGGENNPSNPTSYTIEYPDIVLLNPSRTGYDFLGWSEGGSAPTVNLMIKGGSVGSKSFAANWKPHTYSLTLDPAGGTVAYTQKGVDYDSVFGLPTPSREGYTFAGWFDVQTKEEVKATTWTWANNRSLFAKWETVSYGITYVLNGGTNSSTNPSTYTTESEDITIMDASRSGYTFKGWKTGGGDPTYSPTIPKGSTGDKSYEAVWAANLNTIVFHGNGATSGDTGSTSGHTDEKITLPANGFAKTGYHFTGWANTATGTVAYVDQAEMTVGTASLIDLYAIWAPNTNTVTFHANGGTGTMANQTMDTDQMGSLNTNAFVKEGYHFAGWATSESGASIYPDGGNYKMGPDSNYDLYARWLPNAYTVTLDANGGTCIAEVVVTYDAEYSLPIPTREGYYFAGWFHGDNQLTDANGTPLAKYTIPSAITATAHWTPKLNVVLLTDGNQTVQVKGSSDTYVRLPANTFEKDGDYLFDGWSTTEGGTVEFQDKDLYLVGTKSSYTLHAVFKSFEGYEFVSTKEELLAINGSADNFSKNYCLTADIDLEGMKWGGFGMMSILSDSVAFTGTFDGRGHTIHHVNFRHSGVETFPQRMKGYACGLFKCNAGIIKNVDVTDATVDFSGCDSNNFGDAYGGLGGLIAAWNDGIIANCHVAMSGSIRFLGCSTITFGGICGRNNALIKDCFANLDVSLEGILTTIKHVSGGSRDGTLDFGSLIGENNHCSQTTPYSDSIVRNCYAELTLQDDLALQPSSTSSSSRKRIGAACGWQISGTVEDSYYIAPSNYSGVAVGSDKFVRCNVLPLLTSVSYIKYVIGGRSFYSFCNSHELTRQTYSWLTKKGYSLIGWSLSDGGPLEYDLEEEIGLGPNQSTLTLYAAWQKNTNTINFNGNGSTSGEMSAVFGKTDDSLQLPVCSFNKDGYHCAGWARTPDGEIEYANGATILVPSDSVIDLYAIWEPNTNTIVFHANGGSGSMSNQSGLTDSTFSLNQCSFVAPDGCYFAGWALSEGGGPVFADCGNFEMGTAAEYHLYAVWRLLD